QLAVRRWAKSSSGSSLVHSQFFDACLPRTDNVPIRVAAMVEITASTENDHVSEVIGMFVPERCRLLGRFKPLSFAPIATQAVTHRAQEGPPILRNASKTADSKLARGSLAVSGYESTGLLMRLALLPDHSRADQLLRPLRQL